MNIFLKKIIIIAILLFLFMSIGYHFSNYGWNFFTNVKISSFESQETLKNNLKLHVFELSEKIGNRSMKDYENLQKTSNYIAKNLKNFGYDVELQEYEIEGKTTNNIIVNKKGSKNNSDIIIVGSHYDTYDNPGADDNSTGVAALLEIARLLFNNNIEKEIRMVFFSNEEPPYFKTPNMGSYIYAKELLNTNEKIELSIIIDMIGYYSDDLFSQIYFRPLGFTSPNKGNFIMARSLDKTKKTLKNFKNTFELNCNMPMKIVTSELPENCTSDNWSFEKNGYPSILLFDSAFYRNKNYHKKEDMYDKLNYDYMTETVWGIYNSIIDYK